MQRLLFIGLDAADAELIELWSREGWLPEIAGLRAQGTWARLRTTAEVFHVSAWPSIFTGVPADHHGLYHAYVLRPGRQGPLRPRPDQSPVPFFWKILSDQGRRSVVMDAFLTCPLRDFNGAQIVDWGSWSWFWTPTIAPARLKSELLRRFGRYPAEDHSRVGITPPTDPAGFHARLVAGVEYKMRVITWLMEREAWDCFIVVFGEAHPAGHYFWHFHDPAYITHPGSGAGPLREALLDVYRALDRAIGELVRRAGADTTILLTSGDGMCANYSGSHLLNPLLARMGVLKGAINENARSPAPGSERAARRDVVSRVRNMIPQRVRMAISGMLPRSVQEQLSLRWKTAGIQWPATRAFVLENANEGYVRINLVGREPNGIVTPGVEYDALCNELSETARSMTNPVTGKPAALAVYKTDDICDGPCRSHMPDVVIIWNVDAKVTTELMTEKYGIVRTGAPGCAIPPFYTGNHWPNAFALAVGPAVEHGEALQGSILDLAPAVLDYFGIDPPDYMTRTALNLLAHG